MKRPVPVLVLFVLVALPAVGAQTPAVPVYTNADLARFAVPQSSPAPIVVEDPGGWEFVREFIDREHARIDAGRNHELERRRVEIEADQPVGYGEPYFGLGYYGYRYGYGYDRGSGAGHRPCAWPSAPRPAYLRPAPHSAPIIPIHAR